MLTRELSVALAFTIALGTAGCGHGCGRSDDDDIDEGEDSEDRADGQLNFWRCQVSITGAGRVSSPRSEIYCVGDGTATHGECGPHLFRFPERVPPLLRATAEAGWRFERWESQIRRRDGSVQPRPGPMPDSVVYLNGFGYEDTGELEIITAVFVVNR